MRTLTKLLIFLSALIPTIGYAQFRPIPKANELLRLRDQAAKGESVALYQLATCHAEEIGVEMDYAEALKLYTMAAEKGDAPAMAMLSVLYRGAPGITAEKAKSLEWARKGEATGHPAGLVAMAWCHARGYGVAKSEDTAARLLRKAAADDNAAYAKAHLAVLYLYGGPSVRNASEGFRLANVAASKGDRIGQVLVGQCYLSGTAATQDVEIGRTFLERAAANGSLTASAMLARLALDAPVPETEKAFRLINKGVRQQDADSCYLMGLIYLRGIGVPQSFHDATPLIRLAAESGHAQALQAYADICLNGKGRLTDETLGLALLVTSSLLGNDEAQRYLDGFRYSDRQSLTYQRATLLAQSIKAQIDEGEKPTELADNWHSARSSIARYTPARPGKTPNSKSTGSGMVFTADGHCFTNHHVVEDAKELSVYIPSTKQTLKAKVVASDEANDLAIIKIEGWKAPEGSPALPPVLSSASRAKIGDKVFAVGYPLPGSLGQEPKYTSGDVSALSGISDDRRIIQTTTPIQPGNSGGPLALQDGRVVGIVVSSLSSAYFLRSTSQVPQNVNFAVKADYLKVLAMNSGVELSEDAKPGPDPIEHVKAYTVQIIAEM